MYIYIRNDVVTFNAIQMGVSTAAVTPLAEQTVVLSAQTQIIPNIWFDAQNSDRIDHMCAET